MVSRNRKSAGGGSRSGSSRSSRSRSQNMPERDEEGRFVSDEDEGTDGGNYSAGEDDIDDDVYESRGGGGYGRGGSSEGRGWYGDYEGHSEAAQRGWEQRGGQGGRQSAGGRHYGGGQQMRNDDYYDDRYESRGGRGGGYNDDIGEGEGRGWFGDYEGHSEAAQLGWEHRGRSGGGQRGGGQGRVQSRNRGGQSQSRGGQQGGHGGWFGDPRGHAEAARRGWQDRR